eukprot:TRINITY_DN355_c0_g1_i1.p4 TRINITY_DN355_c0_g1~~TRINITY_DN355_c0_g1_i1.p4  ORF type:complete len:116 (+),score=20.77 TRINITY_DN355_c0_g1_i1:887-1234(+)
MLTAHGGSDHCPIFLVLNASKMTLSPCAIVHELSSDRIKMKQPKLLQFFQQAPDELHASPTPEVAVETASSMQSDASFRAPTPQPPARANSDSGINPPASKKRKLTDFFAQNCGQ